MIYETLLKNYVLKDSIPSRLQMKCLFPRPLLSGFPQEEWAQKIGQMISELVGDRSQLKLEG